MLTWTVVGALAIGVYGQRMLGAVFVDTSRVSDRWQRVLSSVPLAVIVAVVALQTLTSAGSLTIDERAVGVIGAAVCAWRKLPIAVTVVVAAGLTALTRLIA